jgi:hypothetical protein
MLPLHRAIAISVFEQTSLSEDLKELYDENLKLFFEDNCIIDTLYNENIITWQGDYLVLKNVKSKGTVNYWDEVKKFIDINGQTVEEWDKSLRMMGRLTCHANNIVQIGKLLKIGYSYQQIGQTISYVARECGQYTEKLTKQLDPLVFKQNFEKKDLDSNTKLTSGFKR